MLNNKFLNKFDCFSNKMINTAIVQTYKTDVGLWNYVRKRNYIFVSRQVGRIFNSIFSLETGTEKNQSMD